MLGNNLIKIFVVNIIFIFLVSGEQERILVNSEILFTIPHEGNIIRFECSEADEVVAWILPDETEILISSEDNSTFIVDPKMNVTKVCLITAINSDQCQFSIFRSRAVFVIS